MATRKLAPKKPDSKGVWLDSTNPDEVEKHIANLVSSGTITPRRAEVISLSKRFGKAIHNVIPEGTSEVVIVESLADALGSIIGNVVPIRKAEEVSSDVARYIKDIVIKVAQARAIG